MLQVAFIRQNVDFVKERLAVRNFRETSLVDTIVSLDDQRKKLQMESEATQAKINALSKEIGQLMGKAKKDGDKELEAVAEAKKAEVSSLKEAQAPIATRLAAVEE